MTPIAERGGRVDKLVAEWFPGSGRRAIGRLFEEGRVRVNGRRVRKGERVEVGDVVEVSGEVPGVEGLRPVAQAELGLEIIYLDEVVIGIAKPPGMATQPLRAGEKGTLANALVARHPECASAGDDPREAGFAHRLDTGTSGAIVAARDRDAWRALRQAFREGRVEKRYLALVVGEVHRAGEIDEPIAHDRSRGGVRVGPRAGALSARTTWEPVERFRGYTLLRCGVDTGRMHQVRAHLAHAGTPIAGDTRYGAPPTAFPLIGHFLHAETLALAHPRTGAALRLEAPLPADRADTLRQLRG